MEMRIAPDVIIEDGATIDVTEYLEIGEGSHIRSNCIIEGRWIRIGKRFWMDWHAHIGGGSCFDVHSKLVIGDDCHMGRYSHINTAREVKIGNEVGIGIGTRIYTHGAYLPENAGFPVKFAPVTIGNRVWMPEARVMPGTAIEDNVVIATMSLVEGHLRSGCLYGGVPAKLLKENVYPKQLSEEEVESINDNIRREAMEIHSHRLEIGLESDYDVILRNQLRRHGIRSI
jgi:acetyltransferase-like isoleucine patch superfamily enzyme